MADVTVAFAGTGDVSEATAEALLNDLLGYGPVDDEGYYEKPDNEVTAFFVVPGDEVPQGLDHVVDWSARAGLELLVLHTAEHEDALRKPILKDADKHIAATDATDLITNTLAGLLKDAQDLDREVHLILLLGTEPDPFTDALLKAASEANVSVLDLTAGLDEIQWVPGEEDEPEAEEPHQITVEEAIEAAEEEDLPHDKGAVPVLPAIEKDVPVLTVVNDEAVREIVRDEVRKVLESALRAVLPPETVSFTVGASQETPEAPKPSEGRTAAPRTSRPVAFIRDEDGELQRKGRGKPRAGVETVYLTLEEAREQGWEG